MQDELSRLLAKAVALENSMRMKKQAHKELTENIKQERAELFVTASSLREGSPAMDEIYRKMDLLDQKEFDNHERFRNFLRIADTEINKTIKAILEYKFGPYWRSDTAL